MLFEVILQAATPAPAPSYAPMPTPLGLFAAGLPGLLTGIAAVVVAILTGRMARKDRAEALLREDRAREDQRERYEREDRERLRQERAEVHDAIVAEVFAYSRARVDNGSKMPDSRPLGLALSAVLTHLGASQVYYSALGLLTATYSVKEFNDRLKAVTYLQMRLDEWFLGNLSDASLVTALDRMRDAVAAESKEIQADA